MNNAHIQNVSNLGENHGLNKTFPNAFNLPGFLRRRGVSLSWRSSEVLILGIGNVYNAFNFIYSLRRNMTFIPECKSTDHWQTPDNLKDAISRMIIPFDMLSDPCPNNPIVDGLNRNINIHNWGRMVYCNPPYSSGLQLKWAQECVYRVEQRSVELCLLLIRFDPTASHFKYMMGRCSIVWMPDKRLKFVGAKDSYNFPLALYQIQMHPPKWPVFQSLGV